MLFALRFILARATQNKLTTNISNIINSYYQSGLGGDEGRDAFLGILDSDSDAPLDPKGARQPSESIKVLAQLSYLTATKNKVTVSLTASDAANLFEYLKPVCGPAHANRAEEIDRRAELFPSANAEKDYPHTVLSSISEAGFKDTFKEGHRVRRTHVSIERNRMIRDMFFKQNPELACDLCGINTRQIYPWTDRLLEIHHLLPLCSGARTSKDGTLLEDLVANCPSCHRATHRYYETWLAQQNRIDFADAREAKFVYLEAKRTHLAAVGHARGMQNAQRI